MLPREPPPAEPVVAELLRRIDVSYFDHADRMVLDPWVRDVAQHSCHDEVAAGALANLANHYFFMGELNKALSHLDRADEIFARTPMTSASLTMRWVTYNVRGFLVETINDSEESLREAIEHNMAGMRFAATYGLDRGIAISALNAALELVQLGEPVEALLLMTRLLETSSFDQRCYAHIREVIGFALASGGYDEEALGQFQIVLDSAEPHCYALRARVSITMADCAINAGQLDIARFELQRAASVLDFIEAEQGCPDTVETHRNCLDRVRARLLVRDGKIAEALTMIDEAFRVNHDWFLFRSNCALDVWLEAGKAHFAFDDTKPNTDPELGGQLRYATLLERCAAETGRFKLALHLRRQINAERARHSITPDIILKVGGPNPNEIRARQQRTQVEIARVLALADWHDNLLAMTAHELRGPLTALQLVSELLMLDAERANERLQNLVPLIERIRRTTEGFQALIHLMDNPVPASVEARLIGDELRIAVDSLRDAAQTKNITVRTAGLDAEYRAHVGRGSVVISVANLLSNAIKYSPRHSIVDLSVSLDGDRIMVDVCDQGPGIAPKDRAIAFDWEVRLDHQPTGNESSQGLGLSITRTLVEAAGGTVEVLDRPPSTPGAHLRITWRAVPRTSLIGMLGTNQGLKGRSDEVTSVSVR